MSGLRYEMRDILMRLYTRQCLAEEFSLVSQLTPKFQVLADRYSFVKLMKKWLALGSINGPSNRVIV